MALQNRAAATSTTSGTGALTLGAAPDGYAALTDGEQIPYLLAVGDGTWEVGYGTVSGSGATFTRTLPLEGTAAASLPTGSHTVYCVPLAQASLEATADPAETLPAAGPSLGARGVAAGVTAVAGNDSVAIGYVADGSGLRSVTVGRSSRAGDDSVCVGRAASDMGFGNNVLVGAQSSCSGVYSIVIGPPTTGGSGDYVSAGDNTINIGSTGTSDPPSNTVIIGQARAVSSGQRIHSQLSLTSISRRVYQEIVETTTNATPTLMPNIPLNGGSGTFELSVMGVNTGGGTAYAVRIQGAFYNGALIGTPVSTVLVNTLAGAVSVATSGGNLQVTVTGVAATTVSWGAGVDQYVYTP